MNFYQYVLHGLEHLLKPRRRTWQQSSGDVFISEITPPTVKPKKDKKALAKEEKSKTTLKDLDKLTKILDSGGKV